MFLISGNLSNFFLFNFFIVLFLSDANTTRDDVKSELLAAISSSLAAIATTRQRFVRSLIYDTPLILFRFLFGDEHGFFLFQNSLPDPKQRHDLVRQDVNQVLIKASFFLVFQS